MQERGASVDSSTINRSVPKDAPQIEQAFQGRKRPVWLRRRLDETGIRVKGQWRYLYRAVDKMGQTIDFLLTERRDEQAATRLLTQAIRRHGIPEIITIYGSKSTAAALLEYHAAYGTMITIRRVQCPNNSERADGG